MDEYRNKRISKRLMAIALTVSMVLGPAWPGTAAVVYASTELSDQNLGNGHSDTLAYTWKASEDYNDHSTNWGGESFRYDLMGLRPGDTTYEEGNMTTTFQNYGFPTYLVMSGTKGRAPRDQEMANGYAGYNPTTLLNGNYVAKHGQWSPDGTRISDLDSYPYYNGHVDKILFGPPDNRVEVEMRITTTPSPDKKYIYVDYYICHVGGNIPPEGKTFWLGSPFDLLVAGSLSKDIYKTNRGFYAVNSHTKATVDVITNDAELGITEQPTTRWLGFYAERVPHMFTSSEEDQALHSDNSLAYSWEFKLRPYETVKRRVAFSLKQAAYYVSYQYGADSSQDSSAGTYNHPYKTLEYAISQCRGKNAYIFVEDYKPIDEAVSLTGGALSDETSITISSSDFDINGNVRVGTDAYLQSLKRAAGYTGPIFTLTQSAATVHFTDIILDGNGVEGADPLVKAATGELGLIGDTEIKNSTGGALDITGNASLYINGTGAGAKITNNQSLQGAVRFDSSGTFSVLNQITIRGNTRTGGNDPADVYLTTGKYITVEGDLGASRIGVTTEELPVMSSAGEAASGQQEVRAAIPSESIAEGITDCPFADNFFSNLEAAGIMTGVGSKALNNEKYTVMKKNGYAISFAYRDVLTGGTVEGAPFAQPLIFPAGDSVIVESPSPIPGYVLKEVTLEQGANNTLVSHMDENSARITGTMPAQDVVVTYEYKKTEASITFYANGGSPQPEKLTGTAGESVNALLPSISRYGYRFEGWSRVDDRENPDLITALPSVFPADPVSYYAIFVPDPLVKFGYAVDYTNQDGSIVFQTTAAEHAYAVESQLNSEKKNVHGYVWSPEDSAVVPAQYNYDGSGPEPVGTFDEVAGNFSGRMPGQDTAVHYGYRVDRENEQAKSDLTVRYVSESGNAIHALGISSHFPEDDITAEPVDVYGYQFKEGKITAGTQADSADGHLVSAVTGNFDGEGAFTGTMPNQPVEITYVYEATDEGYAYTVTRLDLDSTDTKLKHIAAQEIQNRTADMPVEALYQEFYGYALSGKEAAPASAGSFDSAYRFSGTMPNEDLAVTYRYHRVPDKWAEITYRPGTHGILMSGDGVSSDVKGQGDGTFAASVLRDDGSAEAQNGSYTWKQIQEKHLLPSPKAQENYQFAGWFLDENGNGIKDTGEEFIRETHRFEADTTVTAFFEEDPNLFIDISFAAGEHGALAAGAASQLHVKRDKTWEELHGQLPGYAAETNYLVDGWYDGDRLMEDGDSLQDGNTYTIRFKPDPAVFGTEVKTPEAMGGLDSEGRGKITVFNTTSGYRYLLTDLQGTILESKAGSSFRVYFEQLYPGMRYRVYETVGSAAAAAGMQISEIGEEKRSEYSEVLTPVVEHNYQVTYDEKQEGKAILTIRPADKNSDYAVLDSNGSVLAEQTGAGGWQQVKGITPGSVTFGGLACNEEYTVVARPRGKTDITAESRLPDGTVITTDPGGGLDIPNFIVETIRGEVTGVGDEEVHAARYDAAHKGDQVVITADETDGAGENFLYWKLTIGSVPGIKGIVKQRTLTFTMPDSNLVFTAYYARPAATPSHAKVVDEVRGGSEEEIALDPETIPDLEEELTTDDDRTLLDVNHADVTYKVVFKRNKVKATESNAVREEGGYRSDSYQTAWGLNVEIERYVNGRETDMDVPEDLEFNTYIQLDKDAVDMLDYHLYAVTEDQEDGSVSVEEVTLSDDPADTGGLFTFSAKPGIRYILAYARAYRLYFINHASEPAYQHYFKVRRGDAPSDSEYSDELDQVEHPEESFVSGEGVEYELRGWSYKENKWKEFDPDREITRKTYVYACYENNSGEVGDARKDLEEAIRAAIEKSDDHFLTANETGKIREAIEAALEVFERTEPQAQLTELQEALERLEETCNPYEEVLDNRYDHYDEIRSAGSSGGAKGGGGSGGGGGSAKRGKSEKDAFVPVPERHYTVGGNGQWRQEEGRWSFVLNGGIRLSDTWARLDYTENPADKSGWYRFNTAGFMESGWYYDDTDHEWYYLDPVSGRMAVGWNYINGLWYYLALPADRDAFGRPLGSMYKNEKTPDGFWVGPDGSWKE